MGDKCKYNNYDNNNYCANVYYSPALLLKVTVRRMILPLSWQFSSVKMTWAHIVLKLNLSMCVMIVVGVHVHCNPMCFNNYYRTIAELITHLQRNVPDNATFEMVVRRSHVLADALRRMERKTFTPLTKLKVRLRHLGLYNKIYDKTLFNGVIL